MFIKHVFYFVVIISLLAFSCKNPSGRSVSSVGQADSSNLYSKSLKPASNYTDTLIVNEKAAVFYYPDSLQLKKIEMVTDKNVFESMNHEFFYQIRNSKIVLNKNWKDLKIIDAKNLRYLLFKKSNNTSILIDLDGKSDPYGLFLFDPSQEPHFTDMMNIDTELSRYFSK